jgi:hypothetical protein
MTAENGDFSRVACNTVTIKGLCSFTSPTEGNPSIIVDNATLHPRGAFANNGLPVRINGVMYVIPLGVGA